MRAPGAGRAADQPGADAPGDAGPASAVRGTRSPDAETEQLAQRRSWRAGLGGYAVVLVASAGLSAPYLGRALWQHPARTWQGNVGDPEQIIWSLSWVLHAMVTGHNPLLTNAALYPEGANMMWNTSLVFPGVLISPVTLIFGPTVSYNVLLVLAPITTALTTYALLGRWVRSRVAAAVGALVFAFSPFMMVQSASSHLHVVLLALVPLMLLTLDDLVIRQRWSPVLSGGLLGLFAAGQLLTAEEMLAAVALLVAAALLVLALLHPRGVPARIPHLLRGGVAAAVVFGVLAGYPLYVQLLGPRRAPGAHPTSTYVTDLMNLVQPVLTFFGVDRRQNQDLPFTGNAGEWSGYLGVPLLLLIVIVVAWSWRRPVVRAAAILLVIFLVLSFGPYLHINGHGTGIGMPWGTLEQLPLLGNLLAGRLSSIVDLAAAVLVAVFIDELSRLRRRGIQLAGAGLVVLIALSLVPNGIRTTTIPTPAFFTSSALDDNVPAGSVTLVVPYVYRPGLERPMLWQANADMYYKMVDGWLIVPGPHNGTQHIIATTLDDFYLGPVTVTPALRSKFTAEMRAREVRTVLVAPMPHHDLAIRFFRQLFGRDSDIQSGDVDLWRVPNRA